MKFGNSLVGVDMLDGGCRKVEIAKREEVNVYLLLNQRQQDDLMLKAINDCVSWVWN